MHLTRGLKAAGNQSGQVLILFALLLPLLMLFTGFAIDFGFGFLAKAELAKGCDGANLEAMLNYGLGTTQAGVIGTTVFNANFIGNPIFSSAAPTAAFTFATDPTTGDPVCNCTANASVPTYFIKLMGIRTLNVGNYSQATRPPVLLSLVLDRTGSMGSDGGAGAMPGAVTDFDQYFIEGTDKLGEVSFAWSATNDVPISTTFKSAIQTSVDGLSFQYGTYSMGGLQAGFNQITSAPTPTVNTVKVVVFFTDGWDNTIQAYLPNPTATNKVMVEFGGDAATSAFNEGNGFAFVDPNNVGDNSGNGFYGGGTTSNPTTTMTCQNGDGSRSWPTYTSPVTSTHISYCNGATTFVPIGGTNDPLGTSAVPINRINITADAELTTYQLAEQMRAQGITVYSIGLASSAGGIDQTYLKEIANDPGSDKYIATEPTGMALVAPTAADLDSAFQTVAEKILLRLTQ